MSGCSLPVDTPFENIQMMMDTVREVGYPVNPDRVKDMLAECRERNRRFGGEVKRYEDEGRISCGAFALRA